MNPDDQNIIDTVTELALFSNSSLYDNGLLNLETALLIDAVHMYYQALKDLNNVEVKSIDCSTSDYWEHGHSLINIIKTVSPIILRAS